MNTLKRRPLTARVVPLVRDVLRFVNDLAASLARPEGCPENGFRHLRRMLESLPLSSEAFALATNRCNNARAFSAQGETGAAAFELKLLRQSIENNPDWAVAQPATCVSDRSVAK